MSENNKIPLSSPALRQAQVINLQEPHKTDEDTQELIAELATTMDELKAGVVGLQKYVPQDDLHMTMIRAHMKIVENSVSLLRMIK